MFFPRGGSAHVARALAEALPAHGLGRDDPVGLGRRRRLSDARRFYAGLDVHAVDFAAGDAPMHPSFEDRPDAPDRVFAALDDAEYERHVAAWAAALDRVGAAGFDVLHLHHLTPLHEAAARVAPDVPVVAHLHGTELLMLERIAAGPPPSWAHADAWAERMRRWAARAERLLLLSPSQLERVETLLGVDAGRCVVCPNGFDPDRFAPREIDRAAHWRTHLVEQPRGWRPREDAGSLRYTERRGRAARRGAGAPERRALHRGQAPAAARARVRPRAARHGDPRRARPARRPPRRVGGRAPVRGGRRQRRDAASSSPAGTSTTTLPDFLNAADVNGARVGARAVRARARRGHGVRRGRRSPSTRSARRRSSRTGAPGWLVPPDDEAALADAMVACIDDPDERARRGAAARETALERWSWPALAGRLAGVLADAAAAAPAHR